MNPVPPTARTRAPKLRPRDARPLARALGRRLMGAEWRLATAESCTGGWIAKALTDVPGSSQWFEAGYVTYSDAAKTRMLGVRAATLAREGAVSAAVVREMARGVLKVSGADIAVAVSGIAGPGGGTPNKPVGTVWFCWARRAGRAPRVRVARLRLRGDREAVRWGSVVTALRGLQKLLRV